MAAAEIKLDKLDGGIFELVVSYPERRNALTLEMWQVIAPTLAPLKNETSLRALIVRGDGAHFCAGADISEFETVFANKDSAKDLYIAMEQACMAIQDIPVPTIAKIKGACMGGGCAVAMACDIRFADEQAKFAIPPAKLGLVYPYADMKRLVGLVGLANAKDLLFSGRVFKAEEALKLGLINAVYPSEAFDKIVESYALGLTEISGYSQRQSKAIFKSIEVDAMLDGTSEERFFLDALDSPDFKEGFKAFLEKRKPNF